jgi:prepilin-type processing-associated H-X9-DG protein
MIEDGTTSTYLIGEKHINPDEYPGGIDVNDDNLSLDTNQAAYCGYEWDNQRRAWNPKWNTVADQEIFQPRQDTLRYSNENIFGSAHPSNFHMVFCDGSVQSINYDIDPYVHSYQANRRDGKLISE